MYIKVKIVDNSMATLITKIDSFGFSSYPNICKISFSDETDKTILNNMHNGFEIYIDDDTRAYDCSEYKYIYDIQDNYIEFSNDNTIYYTYYNVNDDGYVTGIYTTNTEKPDAVLVISGIDKKARYPELVLEIKDKNNCYNYKIANNELTKVSSEEKEILLENLKKEALKTAKAAKITELTTVCQNIILNGIDYNGKHYTYNYSDQNNISNLVQMAKSTGMDVPYHADGDLCELYSPTDIYAIYISEEINVTQNTTYLNQLKAYVDTLKNIDDVNNIVYGQELTGEYLKNLNDIMEHSQKIIEVLNAETTKVNE